MVTRLYLIRHGATTLSAEDRFAGSIDVDISDEGRRQVERLSARLADDRLAAVYCSPLRRCVDTATTVARPHALTPIVREELREIAHGRWEGLRRGEVEQRFGDEYAAWETDPFTFAPEGGESGLHVLARALPVIREIVVAHPGGNVAVVSHKATLRLVISSLLGFDMRGYRDRLDQNPACLNIVDFRDTVRARLMLFNDTSHYTDQPTRARHQLSKWWDQGEARDDAPPAT
jgi:broad specificity phosphatase PhoE